MSKKLILCLAFLTFVAGKSRAQDCNLIIEGKVLDQASHLPLSYVNVLVQELSSGAITNNDGTFRLENICAGEYHLIFSHIGCDPQKTHLHITQDTVVNIELLHSEASLSTVIIKGNKDDFNNQSNTSISRQEIEDNLNENLSGLMKNEAGVHLIKNGSGIAKPVVQGLYGNRLTILNNGIAQSGQQWGNDHSPEIDPFSADKITILKGTNAIEFGGGNLGNIILVEPKKISREPHLHGQINYTYETNGRGNTLNARLEKHSPILAWRINGTLKKYGDRKTASYFLTNTGVEEANLSVQLEKNWKNKLFLDIYASGFNTQLGVLRGSHIGNLTDLEQALAQEIPYYTNTNFSYQIAAPKQRVAHYLSKLKAKYYFNESQFLEFILAGQINNRKEFDVRRNERTNIPALSLLQYTLNSELKFTKDFSNNLKFKIGNQNIITDNTNNPETGILPLIPDYISFKNGTFLTLLKQINNTEISLGIRYDYENQSVASISNTLPRVILRYNNNFHNLGGILAIKHRISTEQNIKINVGYATRNPAINELYSNGLHQGVSGIEEGDVNLKTEKAIKNTIEYEWLPSTNFSVNALAYHQYFNNYIFLNPQEEIRLTIRGAFPVFKYEQTNAHIYGLDISANFTLANAILGSIKYSYLKGNDLQNNIPLVYMPPNNLFASITFRSKKPLNLTAKINLDNLAFELNNKIVFEQKNILPEQDFALPPKTYSLLGGKVSTNIMLPHYKFRFFVKANNLLNIKYRDYLNRQRYFADDTGISITIGTNFKF